VLPGFDTSALPEGVPSEAQFVAAYCAHRTIPFPSAQWPFYVALALFRAAAIFAGVHRRASQVQI
jgi:acyl-CoA dehydrogenase